MPSASAESPSAVQRAITKVEDPKDTARCEQLRQHALTKDPSVRFMLSHLKRAGCTMDEGQIECRHCDGQLAGGFREDGSIIICSNHIRTQEHANTTLVHEAIHAFDQCRAQVDWGNCVHHACSEIRAATLSGDCSFGREVFVRGNFGFAKQFQRCVQRRAEISVSMNPNCDALDAKLAVQTAWDSCYNDHEPFERIP